MSRNHSLLPILYSFLSASIVLAAEPKVAIDKKPVTVTRKIFDPKNPPRDLPKFRPGEEAAAVSWYGVEVYMRVDVFQEQRQKDGAVLTTSRITSVKVTTTLDLTIWLPDKASAALKEHEEGHRRIAELFYDDADKSAQRLAEPYIGRTLTGVGKDRDAAIKAAIDKANQELIDAYTMAVNGPAQRVQDLFDEITDHGRKRHITVDSAIKQAVERQKKEPGEKKSK